MTFWKRLSGIFGERKSVPPARPPLPEEEPEINVAELSIAQLQAALSSATPPLVIDVREPYEWRLVRMVPDAAIVIHIPMNDVPGRLETLPHDREIVVMCAHGSRSYSVAAWLIEQGFHASSLAGGITQWASQGGAVEQG